MALGEAEVVPFDADSTRRKLPHYLGSDGDRWDEERFRSGTFGDLSTCFMRLALTVLRALDLLSHPAGEL
jgi:hypothetical protein